MPKYSPGIKTEEKILSSARELFWNKGFAETTLQEICHSAGIRQSLLFYYFKDKTDLAKTVFNTFSEMHDSLLCAKLEEKNLKISKTVERCLFVTSYFRLSLEHPSLARFIAEINDGYIMMDSSFVRARYEALVSEHPKALEETSMDLILLENLSLNSFLFHFYLNKRIDCTQDEIINFKIKHLLRSLYIETPQIDRYLEETLDLERQFCFSVNEQFEVTYQSE